MLLKLIARILLKKQKKFIRTVKLKNKTYVITVEEYKPINVVIDDYRRTAQEVPVQEQLNENNELLLLLITTSSLISKAIQTIKNDITE